MEKISIEKLKPYEKNAKLHPKDQIKKIADSIQAFGFNQPIVIDKNSEIIVGHGRFEAAKLLKMTEVPYIKLENLTEEEVKAYRLADNKLNETGWNMELAVEELKGLSETMLDLTGFDRDLVIDVDEKDDVVPDMPEEAQSKLGDLYEFGGHRVLCGDSVKVEDVERLMHGKKADLVFTDPPYNVAYVGKTKDALKIDNDKMTPEAFQAFCDMFITNLLTFTNGVIYICMSSSEWGTIQSSFLRLGGHFSRVIIWVKDRMVLSRGDYHTQFEPIGVINEDVNEQGEPILYGWKKGIRHFYKGGRKQTDVWRFNRPNANKEHPTMKPVELVVRAVVNNTEGGGLVFDLFLGSGTTLIASQKTERICYGMELDPRYVDVIVQRYVDYTGNDEIIKNGEKIRWQKK